MDDILKQKLRCEIGHRRQRSVDQLRIEELHLIDKRENENAREELKFIQEVDVQPLEDISDDIRNQIMSQLTNR